MTDIVQVALIGGAFTATPLLVGQWLAYASRKKLNAATNEKIETVSKKADVIHDLADGNLSRITEELKSANSRIELMEKAFRELHMAKDVADKLATKLAETAAGELEMKKQSQRLT